MIVAKFTWGSRFSPRRQCTTRLMIQLDTTLSRQSRRTKGMVVCTTQSSCLATTSAPCQNMSSNSSTSLRAGAASVSCATEFRTVVNEARDARNLSIRSESFTLKNAIRVCCICHNVFLTGRLLALPLQERDKSLRNGDTSGSLGPLCELLGGSVGAQSRRLQTPAMAVHPCLEFRLMSIR